MPDASRRRVSSRTRNGLRARSVRQNPAMTSAAGWDPGFARHRPFFAACAPQVDALARLADFPDRPQAQRWLDANPRPVHSVCGLPLRLVEPPPRQRAREYEAAVAQRGELAWRTRDWHDLMNLLAWCTFPLAKAAINAGHVHDLPAAEAAGHGSRSGRGPRRDALTLLDESGAVVACADPELLGLLRGFRWRDLFVDRRAQVLARMRVLVIGHGLLERARAPWPGLAAHAIGLPASEAELELEPPALAAVLDRRLAVVIEALRAPLDLLPLPLLGLPGWWPDNEQPAFYEDRRIFRAGRHRADDARGGALRGAR
jgi:hypothetical protein